jgi:ABC-type thiamin/hydroxymethylpyrimidine transport system permease subunit
MKIAGRLLGRFSIRNLTMIAAMASLGLAVKPLVVPLAHLFSTPLMIPGGALAGGLYMMWLVVASGLTGQRGSATLVGMIQAIVVMITGLPGSHGVLSLISYALPGLAIDAALLLARRRMDSRGWAFVACLLANVTGTAATNIIFFSLPAIPLLLSLAVAAFSGGLGGLLAWELLKALKKHGIGVRDDEKEA